MTNPYESPRAINEDASAAPLGRLSHARFVVLGFLCLLAGVLYLDRICMSQAVKAIQGEFKLDKTQISYVMMAFTLAYGLFEIPTGRWGDRIGARKVLVRITLCWSLFTALTGAAVGLYSMLLVRFLFGAGEAGAYPNVARVLSRWFPDNERGRAQGFVMTAGQLGGVLAPTLAAYLIKYLGWRATFPIFGAVGVFWAAAFWLWFRDDPAEHPAVTPGELALIRASASRPPAQHESVPWGLVLTNPSIWILGTIITCSAFNSYFYFSWFGDYLMSGRGVEEVAAGKLTSLVLAGSAIGTIAGGFVADWLVRRFQSIDSARRWLGGGCFALAAMFLVLGIWCQSPAATATLAALSCLAAFLMLPTWWSCAIKISGKHVGSLFGLMNMMGVAGAMASQYFIGKFVDLRKSWNYVGRDQWDPALYVFVVVLLTAATLWACYRSVPVEPETEKAVS